MTEYYCHGVLHREAPAGEDDENYFAVLHLDGEKAWFKNNQLHRENDKPAVICSDGLKEWYYEGKLHRENDQPAFVFESEGRFEWWKNGVRYRENDKPAMILKKGFTQSSLDQHYLEDTLNKNDDEEFKDLKDFFKQEKNPAPREARDIPIWVKSNCCNQACFIWFVDGKVGRLHDMPALITNVSNFNDFGIPDFGEDCGLIWALNGVAFRENCELPTYMTKKDGVVYMKNGLLHRVGAPAVIERNGHKTWCFEGKVHRDDDLPAVESEKCQQWVKHGVTHRDNDQPAVISKYGKVWYINGKKHRENDLPAVEAENYKLWCKDNVLHRDDDKPAVIFNNGQQEWWKHGKRHRDNELPAIIVPNGHSEYWVDGKRHRESGPAVVAQQRIRSGYSLFFIDNSQEEFKQISIGNRQDEVDEWWKDGEKIESTSL